MDYITSAVCLRKQLCILSELREKALEQGDIDEAALLYSIISRIKAEIALMPVYLHAPTIH